MRKIFFPAQFITLGLILLSLLNSCVNVKKLTYFNTVSRDSSAKIQSPTSEAHIKKNDVLQINVFALDDVVAKIMNPTAGLSSGTLPGTQIGNLVDEEGIIKLPLIGPLKVDGLTKRQLASLITDELLNRKIAKDPVVSVRIINYEVTILGEVNRPGVVPVPNERITLPEAIGAAGDLTIFGKRDNILLIREIDGKRIYKRFSLNNQQIFDSDIYNLQNHDIIYVEPNHTKATSSDNTTQYIPIGVSVATLLVIIYTQLIRRP